MDKKDIAGGIFRTVLLGGAWMRLCVWRRTRPGRSLSLLYDDAGWSLKLEDNGATVYEGTGETFEGVTHLATVALGKNL